MNADVAIIIVTYQSAPHITDCLAGLFAAGSRAPRQVIVVDNHSTDQTVDLIRSGFPQVELVEAGGNLGFARACNLGAERARGDFILLLNPDTVIQGDAVGTLVDFAGKHPESALFGGRTLKPDGSLEPASCFGAMTLWSLAMFGCGLSTLGKNNRWLDPESMGGWRRDTVRAVAAISGCFLMVRTPVWRKLGGFNPRFFMYGEDVDFAMRAAAAGYQSLICPDAAIVHEFGRSSESSIAKWRLLFRGRATLLRCHWRGAAMRFGLGCLLAGTGLRAGLSRMASVFRRCHQEDRWRILWRERHQWLPGYPEVRETPCSGMPSEGAASFPPDGSEAPLLSIIIPVREDWAGLGRCLDSVYQQAGAPDMEIIVVDDGSRTEPPPQLRERAARNRVIWLRRPHRGISATRNSGVACARGHLLLFVDSDCVLEPDCIGSLMRHADRFENADAFQLNIGGGTRLTGRAERLRHAVSQKNLTLPDGGIRWLNTAGFAIRTGAMGRGALFDEGVARAEDTLLLAGLMRRGTLPRFVEGARVMHCPGLGGFAYAIKGLWGEYQCGDSHRLIRELGVEVRASGVERRSMLRDLWRTSADPRIGRAAFWLVVARHACRKVGAAFHALRHAMGVFG